MTPAEARALQSQRPRLPDDWGGTLRRPVAPPAAPATPSHTDTGYLTDRLLRLLYRCADAGERLPSAPMVCAQLRHAAEHPDRSVRAALVALETRGAVELRGSTAVLVATGQVVQVR